MPKIVLPNDFTPRSYQERPMAFLDGGGKRVFWLVHRRGGKDLTFVNQAAKMAHRRVGLYWHMLPKANQGRKVLWDAIRSDGKRIIDTAFPKALIRKKNEVEMKIELKNGSIFQVVGSDNYDTLVGANPVGVTFSEFALAKPSAWNYIRPILAAPENNGWAAFITTPRGQNHAYELFKIAEKDPSWFCETQTILDTGAMPASIVEDERAAGMPEPLIRQEYLCDWTAAMVGSVYGDLMEKVDRDGRVLEFDHPRDGVFTSWDLGISDSTAIWFWRVKDDGIDFIDYYEAHGKDIKHFFDVLNQRGYSYLKHWLPHDAKARTLQTGLSILDRFMERYPGLTSVGPSLSLVDGIQAARWLLQQNVRFHTRTKPGLDALRQYHYDYDEDTRAFSSTPEHDWSSHPADAFRYGALVVKVTRMLKEAREAESRAKPEAPSFLAPPVYTLDDLFDHHEQSIRSRGKRI